MPEDMHNMCENCQFSPPADYDEVSECVDCETITCIHCSLSCDHCSQSVYYCNDCIFQVMTDKGITNLCKMHKECLEETIQFKINALKKQVDTHEIIIEKLISTQRKTIQNILDILDNTIVIKQPNKKGEPKNDRRFKFRK